jgi:hypothetical protein
MRCYFMRGGRIEGVTFLESGPDDARLIEEARSIFEQHAGQHFDGNTGTSAISPCRKREAHRKRSAPRRPMQPPLTAPRTAAYGGDHS